MSNPSPTALVIASLIESALAPIFATMSAPLLARIEELEKHSVALTDEDVQAVIEAVVGSDMFDEAVLGVIEDRSKDVIDNLGDDLTDKINNAESINEAVSEVLRRGSFNIEFSRY